MNWVVQLILFVSLAPAAFAQQVIINAPADDHLEPEAGYFADFNFKHDYYPHIRNYLLKNLSQNPVARVLVLPTFAPEYVISVEKDKRWDNYFLVCAEAQENIYQKPGKEGIQVTVRRIQIAKDLALQLNKLFMTAIGQVSYRRNQAWGVDGTTFHFTAYAVGEGVRSGYTWSPQRGSRMHDLVQVVQLLQKMTSTKDNSPVAQEVATRCENLMKRISVTP
ncbi:hypothetical protein GCM10023189_23430 [Nibrella saemangeumensis]|uniref:Uncharacterized protein n=1 Tax=Nibrella saemangeumensis TaxID=1084526 RepID=A0ABP8MWX4_9BACT